jgi:hypothetical protein
MTKEIPKPFGPAYNIDTPKLQSIRRQSKKLPKDKEALRAYGAAVEEAVLAKQRAQLHQGVPLTPRCPCASRTWINTDDGAIGAAVRRQHAIALQVAVSKERRDRTHEEWSTMYHEAMKGRAISEETRSHLGPSREELEEKRRQREEEAYQMMQKRRRRHATGR